MRIICELIEKNGAVGVSLHETPGRTRSAERLELHSRQSRAYQREETTRLRRQGRLLTAVKQATSGRKSRARYASWLTQHAAAGMTHTHSRFIFDHLQK